MQEQKGQYLDKNHSTTTADNSSTTARGKKPLAIIAISFLSILILMGIAVGILHLQSVQTRIIGKVTEHLEQILQTDIKIAQFHYRPLSHLTIDSIYLSDQTHDTLLYVDHLQLEFHPLQLRNKKIDIHQLDLVNPYINLQSTSDSTLNIQFLIEAFKKDSTEFPFTINMPP